MAPGFAKTSPVARVMHVPLGDTPQERVVRAHEMMHAKVSPAETWPEWLARGIGSERGLHAAEEFRVNELLHRQGFDTKKSLLDGSEKFTGERVATHGLWAEGVYMTAAFAGTARLRPFISGVRKHNPAWADAFRALDARLRALATRIRTSELASTSAGGGLAPDGFAYAESWASLLDLIAEPPCSFDVGPEGRDRNGLPSDPETGSTGRDPRPGHPPAPVDAASIKRMIAPGRRGLGAAGTVPWVPLILAHEPLDRLAPGGLGKTRRAADRGRHPRRIHRLLTDPHRRIFETTTRSRGGVVLIDVSGSMTFEQEDVLSIVEAAPGATVATYSALTRNDDRPNLWVVAAKGRVASRIPSGNGGNGCDGPALDWAIAQRPRATSPIIWVCDGVVTGEGDRLSDRLTLECIDKVLRHGVTMVPDVESAREALRLLATNAPPPRWVPDAFQATWERITGGTLRF